MIRDTSAQDRELKPSVAHRNRRWALLAAVSVLLLASAVFAAKRWIASEHSVAASRIRVAEVRRGTMVRDIAVDARVTAANSPTLYAPATGTATLVVNPGDAIKKGQEVATIDSPELKSKLAQESATQDQLAAELGRFQLRVEQARAKAQSLVDQALVDRQTAKRELEQNKQGFDHGAVPEITMLRAKDALTKADISLASAKQNLSLERKGLEFERRSTELQLKRQQEVVRDLKRQVTALSVRSPVDGVVGVVAVAQSAKVETRAPLATVVDLSALELEVAVPESYARELAVGMAADVDIRGQKVAARVRSVAPEVVGGQVSARLEFAEAPPAGLRQSQRLSARIVIEQRRDVLLIDRGPAFEERASDAYFFYDDVAELRPLTVGAFSIREVEITSGAVPGDRLVISGADHFDGAERIRINGSLQ